jgi:hypothetical protein
MSRFVDKNAKKKHISQMFTRNLMFKVYCGMLKITPLRPIHGPPNLLYKPNQETKKNLMSESKDPLPKCSQVPSINSTPKDEPEIFETSKSQKAFIEACKFTSVVFGFSVTFASGLTCHFCAIVPLFCTIWMAYYFDS